jgi:transcriptional regulator
MGLTPHQITQLIKYRALGWSQQEIAEALGTSQQVIAYQLKKLKQSSQTDGVDDVFNSVLMAGLVGAASGIATFALLELLKSGASKGEKK